MIAQAAASGVSAEAAPDPSVTLRPGSSSDGDMTRALQLDVAAQARLDPDVLDVDDMSDTADSEEAQEDL